MLRIINQSFNASNVQDSINTFRVSYDVNPELIIVSPSNFKRLDESTNAVTKDYEEPPYTIFGVYVYRSEDVGDDQWILS